MVDVRCILVTVNLAVESVLAEAVFACFDDSCGVLHAQKSAFDRCQQQSHGTPKKPYAAHKVLDVEFLAQPDLCLLEVLFSISTGTAYLGSQPTDNYVLGPWLDSDAVGKGAFRVLEERGRCSVSLAAWVGGVI